MDIFITILVIYRYKETKCNQIGFFSPFLLIKMRSQPNYQVSQAISAFLFYKQHVKGLWEAVQGDSGEFLLNLEYNLWHVLFWIWEDIDDGRPPRTNILK